MGLAAPNPLRIDDANERAIATTLAHLSVALGQECLTLRGSDGAMAAERLERCREALGHVDAAVNALRRQMPPVRELPDPDDGRRPPLIGDPMRPYRASALDPRLPLGRYHP